MLVKNRLRILEKMAEGKSTNSKKVKEVIGLLIEVNKSTREFFRKSPRFRKIEQIVSTIPSWEIKGKFGEETYRGTNNDITVYAYPYFNGDWEAEIKVENRTSKTEIARIAGIAGYELYSDIANKAKKQAGRGR